MSAARAAKNDEFYTQWSDIENEMNAYLDYSQDVFRDKVILLPCDDPEWSNFTKFFALNFEEWGIKKLISTSYAPRGNGRIFILDRDTAADGTNAGWEYLDGDGDFRSDEVTALRDEVDMVITNPPFSLYREFVAWLIEGEVQYSIIGNANSVTYKEIFSLIKFNKMWKGATANYSDMVFEVPLTADVRESDIQKAARLGYPSTDDKKFTRLGNSCWFTNIEHGRRHEFLKLMTMEDNVRYCRRKVVRERGYPEYDNYDAIEVSFTEAIPSDYGGVIGVPISFLDKYNPDQFEILDANDCRRPHFTKEKPHGLVKDADGAIDGKPKYARILIRHRR